MSAAVVDIIFSEGLLFIGAPCTSGNKVTSQLYLWAYAVDYGCQISHILWEIPYFSPASRKEAGGETKSPAFDYAELRD